MTTNQTGSGPGAGSTGERSWCPQCGTVLPAETLPELCPQCLLRAGLGSPGTPKATIKISPPVVPNDFLTPGQEFGHYRVVQMLGGGGMGAVFEAEDLDSGRRVALKLLSQALDSPYARERFFREGRLAASINHPNSVYVFGTEEIAGTPVISMELVSGGTLEDRIRSRGPMPWPEAVDAALQIVAGLEAAERIGILHRDVKPSNCFVDAEGVTKVGDFGLSISTTIRTEPSLTVTGSFLGTPAFCSPEQLRGEELSARSDIYSVGATLFYLLTGRTPFDGKNVVAMLATVLESPAPSPRKFAPQVPHGLGRVVRRCLEKQPGERFRTYHELRQALAPYSSAAPVPAALGFRFLAGLVDITVINVVFSAITFAVVGSPMNVLELMSRGQFSAMPILLSSLALSLAYYGISEGLWGATPGKGLCQLRVMGTGRSAPGLGRAFGRAVIYVVVPMLPLSITYGRDMRAYLNGSEPVNVLLGFSFYVVLAMLFCTARRRNGFAALQDLATGTRVITLTRLQQRPALTPAEMPAPSLEGKQRIGPYHILEPLDVDEWRLGYDLRLLRKVWVRVVPAGTPPVPVTLRNLGRATRLRWLTGRRGDTENWDAYEAPSGRSLLSVAAQPQSWDIVRFWLHDLAEEISTATREGSVPELRVSRVWLTGEGRAKLLDFPVPGAESDPGEQPMTTAQFLNTVAHVALSGQPGTTRPAADAPVPLAISARNFLGTLQNPAEAAAVAAGLKPLLARPTEVTRLRRFALIAGCAAIAVPVLFGIIFGSLLIGQWQRSNPGLMDLSQVLNMRQAVLTFSGKGSNRPNDRQFALLVAGKYRDTITNETTWNSPIALSLIKGASRRYAEQCVSNYPGVSPDELSAAEKAVQPWLPKGNIWDLRQMPGLPIMAAHAAMLVYVGMPALLAALLFRGGLILRLTGITFVRRDGRPASRLRLVWRVLVAWLPLAVGTVLVVHPDAMKAPMRGIAVALALLTLAGVSLALRRSLPDRLAGTWPVLR